MSEFPKINVERCNECPVDIDGNESFVEWNEFQANGEVLSFCEMEEVARRSNSHDELLTQLEQVTKERDILITIVENLAPNYDVEELAHHAGIDQDSASRIVDILNNQ